MTVIPQLVNERQFINTRLPRPSSITDLTGTFGTAEVESSARRLISFFRVEDRWVPFTFADLAEHYRQYNWPEAEMLYGLLGIYRHVDSGGMEHWYQPERPLVIHDMFSFKVTETFVRRASKLIRLGAA